MPKDVSTSRHLYYDIQQYNHFEEYCHLFQQLLFPVPNTDTMSQHYTSTDSSSKSHALTVVSPSHHCLSTDNQPSPTATVAAVFQTRVGTVPSFAPKNQSLRDMHMGTATLALKLEPSIPSKVSSNSQRTPFNVSVFSGPHYQPEKYTVKSRTDCGNRYFLPEHFPPSTSETRYLMPSLDYHFQNALKDGSHFASYSEYNAEDPENFRHAYGVQHQPSQLINLIMNPDGAGQPYVATTELSTFNPTRLQQERLYVSAPTPHQQLLDQLYPSSTSSPQTDSASQDERVNQILEAANLLDFNNQFSFTNDNDEMEKTIKTQHTETWPNLHATDSDTDGESSDSQDCHVKKEKGSPVYESASSFTWDQHAKLKNRPSSATYRSKDLSQQNLLKGSSSTAGKTIARVPPSNANTSFHDNDDTAMSTSSTQGSPRIDYAVPSDTDEHDDGESDTTSIVEEAAAEKRPRVEERLIPTKTLTINKCRDWGKFLQSWRNKKRPLVCSICLEPVISSDAPSVVYCDSPQCDVLIHHSCLNRTELPALVQKYWLCDKCFFLDTMDQDCPFVVTCVLCPNTNGVFCKLSPYLHDIPWVHFTCAKVFQARPGDFSYQADLGEYEARFDLIPIDRFSKANPIYASYGAKVTCSDCDKSFHVTCAQMNQVQVSLKSGNARCLSHFNHDDKASQQIQRSKDYNTWINLKEAYLLRQFNKDSRMFAIDIWKTVAKDAASFSMGNRKINAYYIRFLHRIKHVHYQVENTQYSQWINYTLAFFNAVYSARDMESYTVSFSSELFASHKLIWKQYDFWKGANKASSQPAISGEADTGEGRVGSVDYMDSNTYDGHMGTTGRKHATPQDLVETMDPSSPWLMPPHLKSPHQICSICKKTKLPAEVCANLGITESYLKNLETTKDKRPPGHTGNKSYWDPRVFIQCSKCLSILHCGCPDTPIKKHPEKNKVFVCIFCDRHGEMVATPQALGSRRSRKINYKE
ncbi:hypothetical protein MAM1_0112c05597 [Mucor ambiguus]|uniref:Zinc finger PHD-type domain-containing protein n=1 Tax=Mucor ambiguus TaxID=91626 RepID=A0A0C9LV42_9FUNG|nr:hypothetical protein MAM1_0112c05597 [Mucor ambiguus]